MLPILSGSQTVKIFEKFGWEVSRQRGSHVIMTKFGELITLSVPNHREIAKDTLRSLIRSASLTTEEFISKAK
jgi:predicted RNA binding protein YcfA (HicA-like mRNA interferase family)